MLFIDTGKINPEQKGEKIMKHLNQFLAFDIDGFLKDKALMTVSVKDWNDYETKKHMGTKIEVVITRDDTPYRQKAGEQTTNRFEKMTIKVTKDVQVPLESYVMPVHATATVYGEYRNMLSITADDIKVLQTKKGA